MGERLFCPDAMNRSCPVYRNWVKQKNSERLDIIYKEGGYRCLALVVLQDPVREDRVEYNNEIKVRFGDIESIRGRDCFNIKLLNDNLGLLSKLEEIRRDTDRYGEAD